MKAMAHKVWLRVNGELCVECLLTTVFLGMMVYSISTIV